MLHIVLFTPLSLSLHVCQENKLIVVNSCFLARILYSSPILLPDLLRKDLFYLTSSMHHIFSYSNTCKPRQFAMWNQLSHQFYAMLTTLFTLPCDSPTRPFAQPLHSSPMTPNRKTEHFWDLKYGELRDRYNGETAWPVFHSEFSRLILEFLLP